MKRNCCAPALQNARSILAARQRAEQELPKAKEDLEHRTRELVQSERALQEEKRSLELLNQTGMALASKLDMQAVLQTVTDAATQITRALFGAFFFNIHNEAGESYTLYTLSGAPREAFTHFPLPRATALFGPTFRGECIMRSDDVLADPRYGRAAPHHGMPPGHLPVRSYLAFRSSLVQGRCMADYSSVMRRLEYSPHVMNRSSQAWRRRRLSPSTTRMFEASERARRQLQEMNETLEERVAERTESLREMQQQLHQAQKMEAIGQLTGGVAHDFNNLLTVILGNLDTLWKRIPTEEGRLRRAVDHATRGAERAATLTHQLLAFSRRQPLNPKPTDINRLVTGVSEMLRRTLGESTAVETVLGGGLWRVEVDDHQLQNALLNLAINARDAMPRGGKLTIETANTHLDEQYTLMYAEVSAGQYVAPADIAPLGHIDETILVVEDDDDVRLYSVEMLRELGYSVIEADDAMAALRVLDEHPEVQLLFTDVGLPGLNGRELMERARQRRPDLRVLFTTGYARNAIVHHGRLDPGVELLTKPFTKTQLATRVRDVLDRSPTMQPRSRTEV